MKILLLTQDEPFFLAENLRYLLDNLPPHSTVAACVLFNASPFGKRSGLLRKSWDTWRIFGARFLIHYAARFLRSRFSGKDSVASLLRDRHIPVLVPESSVNDPEFLSRLREYGVDLLISIAGNQIFKRPLIDLAPRGCLNLHTALLPKYRGLMPSFWALRFGEKETGVSVFFVDEGIDSGPILVQRRLPIEGLSQEEVIRRSKALGMNCVLEAIERIHHGDFTLIPNEDRDASYFRFPTREDVKAFRAAGARFY